MKKLIPILILLILAACSTSTSTDEAPVELAQYSIDQFMDTKNVFGSSFSPDESKILVSSNASGVYNAYEIDIASGEMSQVTSSTDDAIFAQGYFPNDERILFTSDRGGNELTSVFVRTSDDKITNITPDSTSKSNFGGWNKNRDKFYYVSNMRDAQYFDLYQVNVEDEAEGSLSEARVIYRNEQGMDPSALSEDGRYIALTQTITTTNNNMFLYDTESGQMKLLSEHEGDATYNPQYFSEDGSMLIYTTDEGSEFTHLRSYNISEGTNEILQEEDWDIWYSYLSKNGTYRVTAINEDARTNVQIVDTRTNSPVEIADLPDGDITSVNISDSEKLMTFYASSSKSPSNLFVYNFETSALTQLTNTLNPEINPDDLVEGEVIRYPSFDGMEIPALLYKPKMASADNKVPVLLWIHGGPGGQTRLNYTPRLQYFVNHGYAILAVNNRGSSGYGRTFYKADDRKHGEDDLRDCVESKKFIATLDWADTDKVGILGGSYGGYMVMAALAFAPEEFDLGVNYFGVTNWLRTLKSIPPWWTSFKDALYTEMGDPYQDSVMLYNKSPLFHADKITKPFIVLQGANDPRVLQVESDEIVEAARDNGVEVEYVIFDDEGHGFVKKENNITASTRVLEFLDKHFKETLADPGS